jgi:ribosomal protein S18 acetylase RimI-like enzyme
MLVLRRAEPRDVVAVTAFQHEAYHGNRAVLGVEPLPLLADYDVVLAEKECWLAETHGRLDGVLILETDGEALLIWSIAVAPKARQTGLGSRLLAHAEKRAHELGLGHLTLYTGEKLGRNITWYTRHGFRITRLETLPDRTIVHMSKAVARMD